MTSKYDRWDDDTRRPSSSSACCYATTCSRAGACRPRHGALQPHLQFLNDALARGGAGAGPVGGVSQLLGRGAQNASRQAVQAVGLGPRHGQLLPQAHDRAVNVTPLQSLYPIVCQRCEACADASDPSLSPTPWCE